MALNKSPVSINFSSGLDTKSDSKQVLIGKFLQLKNSVFGTDGLLKKRNGYGLLSTLPIVPDYITTLNGNLTGVGSAITAYSEAQKQWVSKGTIEPVDLSVLPLIHNSVNHLECDSAISDSGLICTVYVESNGSTFPIYYAIADATTGQNIVAPTIIAPTSGVADLLDPQVFIVGQYFVIVFTTDIAGTFHLQYTSISIANPTTAIPAVELATLDAGSGGWGGISYANALYLGCYTTSGGAAVKVIKLTASAAAIGGAASTPRSFAGEVGTLFSLCTDITTPSNPTIYVTYATVGSIKTVAVDQNLFTILSPTSIVTSGSPASLVSTAINGICTIFYEVTNTYSFAPFNASNYIAKRTITQAGTVSPAAGSAASGTVVIRSVNLASKAVLIDNQTYFLTIFTSLAYQSTYFLIRGDSLAATPKIIAKLAYGNAELDLTSTRNYSTLQNIDGSLQVAYLVKDLVTSANKGTAVPAGTQVAGIYTQSGINLARFDIDTTKIYSSEIANNLNLTGGFMWQYDGYLPVEYGFHLYPEAITATWSATGGNIHAQPDGATNTNAYYYQVTYEWSDNQGNIYKSAPSIPLAITTTGVLSTGSIVVKVPTLRLTQKTANPIKIVIYRWSVAQQIYYQVTSISAPVLNSTTVDNISFTDILADATILGNSILYTTGGVVENVAPPAISALTLFDNRLWYINSENRNVLGYSKQVIQSTPVETSDLFTVYVAPTTGVQGPGTGPSRAICGMDDKLIIFKDNAIYYINGTGPDITGANSQYSQPTFITAAVGCSNPDSIIVIPSGIMFQSNKGIWLLGRDLSTTYIGAPVEAYNADIVRSVVSVPGTTQVRLRLTSGIVLMFDYYYNQWGTFNGVAGISSVIYQELDTFINAYGQVMQETPGLYLDNTTPVLLGFTTSWISLAGLQGYERFYHGLLLGTYYTPFKLNMGLAYDYNSNPSQYVEVTPDNHTTNYGDDSPYGDGTPYGGPGNVFEARFFPEIQKCETFQISMQEIYDPSYGVQAGAGLTLSGLNLIVGVKKGSRTQKASQSFG